MAAFFVYFHRRIVGVGNRASARQHLLNDPGSIFNSMKNFRRAIRDSWHFWPSILLATVCSLGVAALWGGNIGALWPVIELTLQGESSQTWLGGEVDEAKASIQEYQAKLVPLQSAETPAELEQRSEIEDDLASARRSLAWKQWFLAGAENYLPTDPFMTVCCIMGVLVVSTMLKHALMLSNDLLIARVSTSIVRSLRMRVFQRGLHLDRRTYDNYGTSGLLANITLTSDALSIGLMNFFGAAVREPLRIVSCLIGAAFVCWRLLFLSLVMAPLLVFFVSYFNRKLRAAGATLLAKNAGFHEVILEALNNLFTVQAYTMEEAEEKSFQGVTKEMQDFSMAMTFYNSMSKPFTELIGVGMIAITVCAGSYLIVNQETHIMGVRICDEPMTISLLLIFFGLLVGASDPLRKLSGVFTSIHLGGVAANGIYGLLDHPDFVAETDSPKSPAAPHSRLTFRDVSFHYTPDQPVLKSLNLTIDRGSTVAIIGPNGSGKSTLLHLLGRYHDPVSGDVMMDDVNYRDMSLREIRQRIAVVSQNTELFNRSVMDNIRYGSPDATDAEVVAAAKQAHADEFITSALEHGYETIVGQSGQRLSGGQRQRIALARAILRDPEILVLDESTSQIDMSSELQIRATLESMKGRFTILIVTHREALLAIADATYEMRVGELIEIPKPQRASAA
ncbi:Lipid A export ATP-binding/permease protein MsbA [Rubripirellula lacrimiformis]|uniref:Lipid A export ATP-binding/permease protein MsbA n=1 Tax=Rubripirellula lacrimiformis TaxID=1930273 RepID=A0A517NEZ7_9BACT|nr:ABC transporter ATP-binding protein [Rubripirellula lacrimiformis]QDT05704.1 Lipid A export ATP-binding/permease protein MsbA [Rubripirellula lacrimiformis]